MRITACLAGRRWILFLIIALLCQVCAYAQRTPAFRWLEPQRDAAAWTKVESALRDELKPDDPDPDTLVYRYKYLKKVGAVGDSALVIVGNRTSEHPKPGEEGAEHFFAFNVDLASEKKSQIINPLNHGALYMYRWKLMKLARFERSKTPDVVFAYLTCWECEPEEMLSAFRYDAAFRQWQVRKWGNGKNPWWAAQDGLVFDRNVNNGGNTVAFDCLFGVTDFTRDGFDDVAIRCKEIRETRDRRPKIADSTLFFTLTSGKFKSRSITDFQEGVRVRSRLCKLNPGNRAACKQPFLTEFSQPMPEQIMLPDAPWPARDLKPFRSLTPGMSMADVVRRCGIPHEHHGSGIFIFVYHLEDTSLVAIGASALDRIDYVTHLSKSGKITDLLPTN